jgi:transposase-like protein
MAAWLEVNVPEGLTVFDLPVKLRRCLRTNNLLEHLNREIKRRTRVATRALPCATSRSKAAQVAQTTSSTVSSSASGRILPKA